jgi:hypothetical protein
MDGHQPSVLATLLSGEWVTQSSSNILDSSEWLHTLGLAEYTHALESHGYTTIAHMMQIGGGEDFEDAGIHRQGHIKRLSLAIRKLKECRHASATGGAGGSAYACTMPIGGGVDAAGTTCMSTFSNHNCMTSSEHCGGTLTRCASSTSTLPRRTFNNKHTLVTEAEVHRQPSTMMMPPPPLANSTFRMSHLQPRPTQPVKPRPKPAAQPTPPTRRSSRPINADEDDNDECCCNQQQDAQKCSTSSLIKLQLHSPSRLLSQCTLHDTQQSMYHQSPLSPSHTYNDDCVDEDTFNQMSTSYDAVEFPPPPPALMMPLTCEHTLQQLREQQHKGAHTLCYILRISPTDSTKSVPCTPRHTSATTAAMYNPRSTLDRKAHNRCVENFIIIHTYFQEQ